jgi:hypothetical protein
MVLRRIPMRLWVVAKASPAKSKKKPQHGRYTKSKLTKAVRKPKVTGVEPAFIADVEERDITFEGLLRQRN